MADHKPHSHEHAHDDHHKHLDQVSRITRRDTLTWLKHARMNTTTINVIDTITDRKKNLLTD